MYTAGKISRFIAFKASEFEYFETGNNNSEPPLNSALLKATIMGDLKRVKAFCNQGADVNIMSLSGWTPLHEAALRNHTKIMSFLLSNDANPNSTYQECLKKIPRSTHNLEVYFYCMQDVTNKCYHNALVEGLFGSSSFYCYHHNNTPLHLAAQFGSLEVVQLLVEAGADPLATNDYKKTPAMLASDEQIKDYFRTLFSEMRLQKQQKI